MNMMHSDLKALELDAKVIDSSKLIDGYIYLSEELAEEKERQKQTRRTNILFGFLVLSVGFFAVEQYRFMQEPEVINLEAFHAPPALGDMLSDNVIEGHSAEYQSAGNADGFRKNVEVPSDIVRFIDADVTIEDAFIKTPSVVLTEVKKPVTANINIDRILQSANTLYKRDRLMSPPVHNAFARYEKVLSVQPDHPEALAGIKKIVDRYVYLADSVIAKNEDYKVPELVKKAYRAGEKYMDVSVIISRFSDYLSDDSLFIDYADTLNTEDKPLDGVEDHGDTIFKADKEIASAAYALYKDKSLDASITMLKNFTQLSGFWGESNDLLLKIYLTHNKVAEAETMIYENKALDAYQFAEKAAKIMMVRGDPLGALNMLLAHRPEFLENRQYYTLMASLYHKVGNYQRSTYWYRQLLSVNHKDPRLWLGLAVSLDAQDQKEEALQAFEYVRTYAKNSSVIKEYADERTLALNGFDATILN
jgi:tetratricopeptide (TPR) repeat protein